MAPHRDSEPATTSDSAGSADPAFGFDHLMGLFQEVISARAAMTVARRAPLGRSRLVDAPRARLLMALEAYTAELNARNLPVPYGIRDDLRIQRRILGRVADTSG
jgi:hypothetical protein